MLRPLPDFDDVQAMAKLGRMYSIKEHWLDAVKHLACAHTSIQSSSGASVAQGVKDAENACARLTYLSALRDEINKDTP